MVHTCFLISTCLCLHLILFIYSAILILSLHGLSLRGSTLEYASVNGPSEPIMVPLYHMYLSVTFMYLT
jgi:hypothetical protein